MASQAGVVGSPGNPLNRWHIPGSARAIGAAMRCSLLVFRAVNADLSGAGQYRDGAVALSISVLRVNVPRPM